MELWGWGKTNDGQLGVRRPNDEIFFSEITSCDKINPLIDDEVLDVAFGKSHTIILLSNGKIICCGSNDFKKCAHEFTTTSPNYIEIPSNIRLKNVYAGANHSLLLSIDGKLYGMGDNSLGQLGIDKPISLRSLSSFIKYIPFDKRRIIQVSSGENHNIALTDVGTVYCWGSNEYGQIGCDSKIKFFNSPNLVQNLVSLNVVSIAAGGNSCAAISSSGSLFMWGHNNHGQLGLSHTTNQFIPTLVPALTKMNIILVSLGLCHTAVLTKENRLFTFGHGVHGQLGHRTYDDEYFPKLITDFIGSSVDFVKCGKNHTIVHLGVENQFYVFGSNSFGQITLKRENINYPYKIHLPKNLINYVTDTKNIFPAVYVGYDHNFCTYSHKPINTISNFYSGTSLNEFINYFSSYNEHSKSEIEEKIAKLFSNLSMINGSFLKKDLHHTTDEKYHGLDLLAFNEAQSLLKSNKLLYNYVIQYVNELLDSLMLNKSDYFIESLRVYVIISIFLNDQRHYSKYCRSINLLSTKELLILENWLLTFPRDIFVKHLDIWKETIIEIAVKDKFENNISIKKYFDFLYSIYKVNMKVNHANYNQFYIISSYLPFENLDKDLNEWLSFKNMKTPNRSIHSKALIEPKKFNIIDYAFVLDLKTKNSLLFSETYVKMQNIINEIQYANSKLVSSGVNSQNALICPYLVITINRETIVHDTILQLEGLSEIELKRPLKVSFRGEEGEDVGGVRKEFFILLMANILNPMFGMFHENPDTHFLWFTENIFEDSSSYQLVGTIIALAIYNHVILDLPFPLLLFKKLLSWPISIDDLYEFDPCLAKNLRNLLEIDEKEFDESIDLNFEIDRNMFGEFKRIPLIPYGCETKVTYHDRKKYVDCYVDYITNTSIHNQFNSFKYGFFRALSNHTLSIFRPEELMEMVKGCQDFDFKEFEKVTIYKKDYYRQHPVIQKFWTVLHSWTTNKKRKFLSFLTGSDRIPIEGINSMEIVIQPVEDTTRLPAAHTCFNILDLPRYESELDLDKALSTAIEWSSQGFGLV